MPHDRLLEIAETNSKAELCRLKEEWHELWREADSSTPFQSPEWLLPWWDSFGSGELWVLTFREGGRLVGLAPLYVAPRDAGRIVRVLGAGNSDYLDVIVEAGLEEAVTAALLEHLASRSEHWDSCDFHQLQERSPLLRCEMPAGLRGSTNVQEVCPRLDLPDPSGHPADVIPQKFYKQISYYRRRTAREGDVSLECAAGDQVAACTKALFRLHGERWRERDESGVLDGRAMQRFHREVIDGMHERGILRLYALRLDGRIVAVYYGFLHAGRAYYYLSGFDPDLSKLSLGHQVVCHAIEEAHREGARIFDFLRGGEDYKYRWGCTDAKNHRRQIRKASHLHSSNQETKPELSSA